MHKTDEARKAARQKSRAKTKNISVDAELVAMLNETADDLETELGFRPTLSQTLKHLLKWRGYGTEN